MSKPLMTAKYHHARRSTATGQYNISLVTLAGIREASRRDDYLFPRILIESATCHLLLHQFNELRADIEDFQALKLSPKSRESCLLRLLYAIARVHTDLALQDAWEDAKEVGLWHMSSIQTNHLEPFDVQIACLYCEIESLAAQLLDVQSPYFSSREDFLEDVRLRLLKEGRFDDLGILHIHQAQMQYQGSCVDSLNDTLKAVRLDDVEMQVNIKVMLAHAFKRDGDVELACQQLEEVQSNSLSETNYERQLFAQYLKLSSPENPDSQVQNEARELMGELMNLGNNYACVLLECWLAELELKNGSLGNYKRSVQDLFDESHSCHLFSLSKEVSPSQGLPNTSRPTYSAHLVWQWYMSRIGIDMKKQDRSSLAVTCCQRFLDEMQQCSIPEMKYTLMTVIAEYYERRGDGSQVLRWRQKANEIAQNIEDEEIRQEASCAFQIALADKTVVVLDDPYGVKQAQWALAQESDLRHLFSRAQERGEWQEQFWYAQKLLEKELHEELRHGRSPCGKEWYSEIQEILNHLDGEKQVIERPRIAFTMAHAKFDAADFLGCIGPLKEVVNESLAIGNKETVSRALFTMSRAYLEVFKTSGNDVDWGRAEAALIQCQVLCEEEEHFDVIACCKIVHAMLWHAKSTNRRETLVKSLSCVTEAQEIWSRERLATTSTAGLDRLLTHYAMTGRNAKTPYSVYGLAVEICFELGRFDEAYQWAECGKAQAFRDDLESNNLPARLESVHTPWQEELLPPALHELALLVHWVINGETLYICACRDNLDYFVYKLEITTSVIEEWYESLIAAKDDLSDAESAEETLSELEALCRPLVEEELTKPGDLMILCPTGVLSKIPIHAIPISGYSTLLERHPIIYTHSFSVLKRCLARSQHKRESSHTQITILGNATGDTPAGETSAQQIATCLNAQSLICQHATKDLFADRAPRSQLIHIHGHVLLDAYPLDQSMLFHQSELLKAREVFSFHLAASHPLVVLIGCGSGVERLGAGDEPLGLVSGFLYAGASAVVATMWPIHDKLAGAAFAEGFYGLHTTDGISMESNQTIDLARRLQRAALSIKANEETKAPYFWAGFVMHGDWRFRLD